MSLTILIQFSLHSDDPEDHGIHAVEDITSMFHEFVVEGRRWIGRLEFLLRTEEPVAENMPQAFLDGGSLPALLSFARKHVQQHPQHQAGDALTHLSRGMLDADVHVYFAAFRNTMGTFSENPLMKRGGEEIKSQKDFIDFVSRGSVKIMKVAHMTVILGQTFDTAGILFVT